MPAFLTSSTVADADTATHSSSHPAGCYLKEGRKYWNTATGSSNSQARRVCTQLAASVPSKKVLVGQRIDKDCQLGTCARYIGFEKAWEKDVEHCRMSTPGPTFPPTTFTPTSQAEYSSLTPTVFHHNLHQLELQLLLLRQRSHESC